ncbi:MAG: hypothetical protein EHM35_03800 [Planctomycetaceae bacterium]|nr:MAG: hypothetical protein EHM35_03800 [Planctomycetaceae bacterium]
MAGVAERFGNVMRWTGDIFAALCVVGVVLTSINGTGEAAFGFGAWAVVLWVIFNTIDYLLTGRRLRVFRRRVD